METRQPSFHQFRQSSSFPLTSPLSLKATRVADDSFATAKRIGTLRASSTPVTLNFRGNVNRTDRVDFLRLDIAPGAAFSTAQQTSQIRGGNIRIITYLELPGQARQKLLTVKYQPGSYSNSNSLGSPVANNFGGTARVYFEIRNLGQTKVTYQTTSTFKP
jgi:hypothetical protein